MLVQGANNLLLNWLPIILFTVFVMYTDGITAFIHTMLGRLLSIALIIYYSMMNKILGVFVCLLVILLYQSDYASTIVIREGMNLHYQ